jgi:hypothetical protein
MLGIYRNLREVEEFNVAVAMHDRSSVPPTHLERHCFNGEVMNGGKCARLRRDEEPPEMLIWLSVTSTGAPPRVNYT